MERRHPLQFLLRSVLRLPMMHLDASQQRPLVWAAVLCGALLGLCWGIVARIWMRLISTNPEFSIEGTVAILIITTIFGTCVGLAFTARRRGWQRWGHYLPRGLVVLFFIPFGIAGGAPLMLTMLVATLAATQAAVYSVWVLAALAILAGTVGGGPWAIAVIVPVIAVAVTIWRWLSPRWQNEYRLRLVNTWLEWIVRTILLLLAIAGFGFVAWGIVTDRPGLLGPLYVLFYLMLLYPLFLALRVGLQPIQRTAI